MFSAFTRLLLTVCVSLVLGAVAFAAPDTTLTVTYRISTDRTASEVNWTDGRVEVCAKGFALGKGNVARAQARSTAYTLLINEARRAIAMVPIDNATRLGAALKESEAKRMVESMVARIIIASEQWDERAGAYTIVGVMPLYGQRGVSYLGAKALTSFKPIELQQTMITITAPVRRGHTPQIADEPYTGIIVNGDDAMLTPCLLPRIMRFDGKELWGPFTLTAADIITGPVRYAMNMETALKEKLAGERPLVLTAVGNGLGCNPVVNLDDVYLALLQQKKAKIFNSLPIVITLGYKESISMLK